MFLSRIRKHPAFEWLLWLGIPAALYLTGLHTEVLGTVQRVLLATGLMTAQPTQTDTPPANFNLTLQTLDGRQVVLKDLKGKSIFLNFWATWCPPCRAEMPGIQSLYEKTDTAKVAFVMVSVDEDLNKVRTFIKRKKYTFPMYVLTEQGVPAQYASQSIPITFVISADGRIVLRHTGMADYDTKDFRAFLQKSAQ